jgi:3-Oxoacyl-[acyl-carrier-protein (ACP)] synthase III C terminal/MerR family regulatory protein
MLARVDVADAPEAATREYRIGELARAAGITARTVRYYQERKLLPPPRRLADEATRDCAEEATHRFLRRAGLGIDDIDLLVPAPAAADFLDSLRIRLGVPGDRVAFTAEDLAGAYTAGPIAALQAAIKSGRLAEARNVLMLAAGAGITVALALYRQAPPRAGRIAMPGLAFAVRGFLTVRRSSLRIPLRGSLTLRADPGSGVFSGDLTLAPSAVSRTLLGARVLVITVQITAESPVAGHVDADGRLIAAVAVNAVIGTLRLCGRTVLSGGGCRTAEHAIVPLCSRPGFDLAKGNAVAIDLIPAPAGPAAGGDDDAPDGQAARL